MKNRKPITIALTAAMCLGAATLSGAQTSPGRVGTPGTGVIPGPGRIPGAGFIPGPGIIPGGGFIPGPGFIPGSGFLPGPGFIPGTGSFLGGGFFPGMFSGSFPTANQAFSQLSNGFNPFNAQMSAGAFSNGGANQFNGGGPTPFNGNFALGNGGFYVGSYGYGDPAFAVTPNGVVPMGNGYNGAGAPSDMDILRSTYAQGYQDAMNAAAAQSNADASVEPDNSTGMTATPRGAASRVPHGSDGVRMWRVGRGQVALRWQGDPRVAAAVTFSVTDRSGRALRSTTVNQLPAEVRFTPPANAVYYQAVVRYVDGATNTIMGKLPQ